MEMEGMGMMDYETKLALPKGELERIIELMSKALSGFGTVLDEHATRLALVMRPELEEEISGGGQVPMEARKASPLAERLMDHVETIEHYTHILQSFTERLDT